MADGDRPLEIVIDGSGLTGTRINQAAHDLGVFQRHGLDPSGEIVGNPPRYYSHPDDTTGQPVDDAQLNAWLDEQTSPDARWTTTPREIIREGAQPLFTSTAPDVANTPVGSSMVPIPYNITGHPTSPQSFAGTVRATDQRLMLLRSREMVTTGAEPGSGLGVASGTINGPVDPLDHSSNVRAEGSYIIRDGDQVWMNNYNTIGVAALDGDETIHLGTIYLNGEEPEEEDPGFFGSLWQGTKDFFSDAAEAIGEFDRNNGRILTRGVGVLQAVGGAGEALLGAGMAGVGGLATPTGIGTAPGVGAMVLGGALAVNGADNFLTGLRTAWTGEFQHTLTANAAGAAAELAGASPGTAEAIRDGADLASGALSIGGGVAAGLRTAAREGLEAGAREGTEAASRQIDEVAEATAAQTGRVTRRVLPKRAADRPGDLGGGQDRHRHLIEQRLEQVVVALVDLVSNTASM